MPRASASWVLLIVLLCSPFVITSRTVDAVETPLLKAVNPLTGDQWFNFTTLDKSVGDTFIINMTVTNVTNLFCWEFTLQWNSSLLTYVNVTVPSDTVFAGKNPIVLNPDTSVAGEVLYGSAAGPWQPSFTGSGTLAQVELRIVQAVGQSSISFAGLHDTTFLIDSYMIEIPSTIVNGYYEYTPRFGDVNHDGTVGMRDISEAIFAFNSFPGMTRWNPFADLDNNDRVDMRDIIMIVLNFDKHE